MHLATRLPRAAFAAVAASVILTAGVVATATAGASAAAGTNPFAPLAGFTILTNGDTVLGNSEIEGTVAVGGSLTTTHGYNFIHTSGLTPADYALPTVGGDPTRLLIADQFNVSASSGVSEVSSRGNIRADQLGYLKIGDISNLALNPRGNQGAGVWASAAGTSAGTQPAL